MLGVAALAGVGSLASAIEAGLAERGQQILGADIDARLTGRAATAAERDRLAAVGRLAEVVRLRAMAGVPDGDRTLVELKAVSPNWPLYGRLSLAGGERLTSGRVAIAPALADRLRVGRGDVLAIGEKRFTIAGVMTEEPEKAGEGFGLGPSVVIPLADLPATGLVTLGTIYRTHYRLKLPPGTAVAPVVARLESQLGDGGFQLTDRRNGAPGTRQFVGRLGQFLQLVGLTALVVAGVGVAGGVSAYLGARTGTIATLKTLGADSATVRATYLWQIGLVAGAAIVVGLILGAATPGLVVQFAAASLPVPPSLAPQWTALAVAAIYGSLIALAFALWPLAESARMPAARLFRSITETRARPGWRTMLAVIGAGAAIPGLAIGLAEDRWFVAAFLAGALALIAVLAALAGLIRWLASRLPRPGSTLARLAIANLYRPGAPTRQLVVALGLGLTLFATLAVIETNFAGQINRTIPAKAPSFFIVDIPNEGLADFRTVVARAAPGADVVVTPSLRGPVTAVKGVPVTAIKAPPDAWILRGDRGLSYAAAFPPNNELVRGKWWPRDYAGPPLVSIDDDAARALGLDIGDEITVSVLGVDVTARIASTRKINWQSMGFNFAILFAPGTLEAAPHGWMATVAAPSAREPAIAAAVGLAFPTASVIRVKDVIGQVADLLGQLAMAIRAAASVTILAGIAVLIGALAAGARARTYDAVLLKLLGATRTQVAAATLAEYGLLALIVAGLALALGGAAGWYIITQVFRLEWQPDWGPVVATVLLGAAVTIVLGLVGSWRALGARPNAVLRTL